MKGFGSERTGNSSNFNLTCSKCGQEATILPVHCYENGVLERITIACRCSSCNAIYETSVYNSTMNKLNEV